MDMCGQMRLKGILNIFLGEIVRLVRYSMKIQREFYGYIIGIYLWDTCRNMIIRFVGKWRGLASNVKPFSFGT